MQGHWKDQGIRVEDPVSVQPACTQTREVTACRAAQMFQFVTMMAQAAFCWRFSPYPKPLSKLLFFYMQTLLALFAHFYVQKYLLGGKGARSARCGKGAPAVGDGSLGVEAKGAPARAACPANGHASGDYTIAAGGKKAS